MRILLLSLGTRGDVQPFVALDALAQSGQRGLIVTGWGGLSVPGPPRDVYVTEFVPYDWLLPRVAAVIHHGGAGTTAAGLRAGKPTVVCPFVADQPFGGRRVAGLGVGPAPIPQRKLTADNLARAMRESARFDCAKRPCRTVRGFHRRIRPLRSGLH
jgi:sterol 3beta-glucosyltransferase